MTNRVDVRSVNKATELSCWCQKNLAREDWQIQLLGMNPIHYKFEFRDPRVLTLAILSS
jgi:hypothetical protein